MAMGGTEAVNLPRPTGSAWLCGAAPSSQNVALARFAHGLQEDLAGVTAGLTLSWSSGPMEGQITRLKLLKRQGYGQLCLPPVTRLAGRLEAAGNG